MTLEEAVHEQLTTFPGLASLIDDRALPMSLKKTTVLPAVTYQRIDSPPILHRGRAGQGPESGSKTSKARFQVDGWARSYDEAVALRKQIRAALTGWSKEVAPRVDRTLLKDDRDLSEPTNGRHRASLDFEMWAEEN